MKIPCFLCYSLQSDKRFGGFDAYVSFGIEVGDNMFLRNVGMLLHVNLLQSCRTIFNLRSQTLCSQPFLCSVQEMCKTFAELVR